MQEKYNFFYVLINLEHYSVSEKVVLTFEISC